MNFVEKCATFELTWKSTRLEVLNISKTELERIRRCNSDWKFDSSVKWIAWKMETKKKTNKPPSRPDVRQSSRISVTSESDGIRKNPSNDSGAILPWMSQHESHWNCQQKNLVFFLYKYIYFFYRIPNQRSWTRICNNNRNGTRTTKSKSRNFGSEKEVAVPTRNGSRSSRILNGRSCKRILLPVGWWLVERCRVERFFLCDSLPFVFIRALPPEHLEMLHRSIAPAIPVHLGNVRNSSAICQMGDGCQGRATYFVFFLSIFWFVLFPVRCLHNDP